MANSQNTTFFMMDFATLIANRKPVLKTVLCVNHKTAVCMQCLAGRDKTLRLERLEGKREILKFRTYNCIGHFQL